MQRFIDGSDFGEKIVYFITTPSVFQWNSVRKNKQELSFRTIGARIYRENGWTNDSAQDGS